MGWKQTFYVIVSVCAPKLFFSAIHIPKSI